MLVSNLKFDTSPTEDAVLGPGAWQRSLAEPTITTKDGKTCAYFNGTTSGLISTKQYFPNIAALSDDWLVSFSYYNTAHTNTEYLLSKYNASTSSSFKPFLISDGKGKFQVSVSTATSSITSNQWNSVSIVHTNKSIYVYINDILANTISETVFAADALNSGEQFTIGFTPGYTRFNGYMSDFRIYKDEIAVPVSRSEIFDDSDKNYYGVKA